MSASQQLNLELRRLFVVVNCWGPVFHLQWEDGHDFLYPMQPECFQTVDLAVAWARKHGHEPEVKVTGCEYGLQWPEEVRQRYWDALPKRNPEDIHGGTPRIGIDRST